MRKRLLRIWNDFKRSTVGNMTIMTIMAQAVLEVMISLTHSLTLASEDTSRKTDSVVLNVSCNVS